MPSLLPTPSVEPSGDKAAQVITFAESSCLMYPTLRSAAFLQIPA